MLRQDFMGLIQGLENGNRDAEKLAKYAAELEPVLIYFALNYIREKYPPGDPRSEGVTARLVELTTKHPTIVKASKRGEQDAMVEWFKETYNTRSYFADLEAYVELIIEKFDS